jgi:hypothetical protein
MPVEDTGILGRTPNKDIVRFVGRIKMQQKEIPCIDATRSG